MKEQLNYYGFNWPKKAPKQNYLNNYAKLTIAFIFFLSISFLLLFYTANAQTLPTGFSQVQVATGIGNPTVMAFAPDGRIFIATQTGDLLIYKNGALLATPFISLPVNSNGERGLLGIAFDPNFSVNNFIYLYYTILSGANNRISRFTANGDVAVPGSEVIIKDLDPLSGATNHNGGTMQFGPDGKLYIGIGENANSANSQNLDTYLGKILRINSDGSIPVGNPYTLGTVQKRSVWSYGLRNPYTISFQPGTGRLFVNDVGEITWEEINEATNSGLNFGWPGAEGFSTIAGYTNPVYAYGHGNGLGLGCAITGGTFFNPTTTNYPAAYIGNYFYLDFCGNWIDVLNLNGSTVTRTNFASNIAGYPVSLQTGTDGNLYFLSRDNSALYKIVYTSSSAPLITSQPQSITVSQGNSATFSVSATGSGPLTYQWFKNGVSIPGATSSTYTISSTVTNDQGSYAVKVTNSFGNITSNSASLTVTSSNQPPTATIVDPTYNFTYAAGDVISFSGTATDPEQGTLGAASFSWFVEFHHDTHTHPGPTAPQGVTSGTFVIPNVGETAVTVYYRLFLVVTDAQGATDTAYTDILPRTTQINISTNPQGLQITLDGQPGTAPYIFTSVEGMIRAIGVPSPQTYNGQVYYFTGWTQGGSQNQNITTPVNDITYTANFSTSTSSVINAIGDAFVRSGSFMNKNYGNNIYLSTKTAGGISANYLSYLKFDISALPTNLTNVTFRLYGHLNNTNNPSVTVQLFDVPNQSWLENTITYANRPTPQANVITSIVVSGTTFQVYDFDVTQHIIALKNSGATEVTFMIKDLNNSSSRAIFNSSENVSNQPQLRISGTNLIINPPQFLSRIENINLTKKSADQKLTVYPNPVSDIVNIEIQGNNENGWIKIMDIKGSVIKEVKLTDQAVVKLDLSGIQSGIYYINYIESNMVLKEKIIITR